MVQGDLLYNYLAFVACVVCDDITIENSIAIIVDARKPINQGRRKSTRRRGVLLVDTLTNTETLFDSYTSASMFLGVHRSTAGIYVKSGDLYKNRYYFKES